MTGENNGRSMFHIQTVLGILSETSFSELVVLMDVFRKVNTTTIYPEFVEILELIQREMDSREKPAPVEMKCPLCVLVEEGKQSCCPFHY